MELYGKVLKLVPRGGMEHSKLAKTFMDSALPRITLHFSSSTILSGNSIAFNGLMDFLTQP
jgi:hypothetical protein